MGSRSGFRGRIAVGIVQVVGLGLMALSASVAPAVIALGLATTAWPLLRAWRGARGTALTSAVAWAGAAVVLGLASQVSAWFEPLATGRPLAGHLTYLSVLATLAALISVLNARTPGAGAWAILMGLLVLIFLIPWLQAPGLARNPHGLGRLRLDAPWTIFYGLVVLAGVTNYLPTRYGPAAAWLGLGFAVEYLGLRPNPVIPFSRGSLWSFFPWALAAAIWMADWRSRGIEPSRGGLDASWLWFRDHWGVVWALRVQERFNRTAEAQRWPFRLGWFGVVPDPAAVSGVPEAPASAEATFKTLLRRFASPGRIDQATAGPRRDICPSQADPHPNPLPEGEGRGEGCFDRDIRERNGPAGPPRAPCQPPGAG
jgi:hypothetical protein